MATKETLRTRLARARAEAVRSGRVVLGTPALMRGAEGAIHFLLAAVLAGGQLFGGYAPFALALVGAAGSGVNAAAALAGASFGYLTLMGLVDGLRYVSASILTFSVAFAFYDVKLYKLPWTMPVVAAAMDGCTGFVYLSQRGWTTREVIFFVLEILITAAACYGFRAALASLRRPGGQGAERRAGGMLLGAAVLVSLSNLYLVAEVSVGRLLAAAAVMACAWQGGTGAGAVSGVVLGLAMDLARGETPVYAMAFGAAGLCAGLCRGRRRLSAAVVFVLANAGAVLWTWDSGLPLSILYEVFAASVLFLVLPERPLRTLGAQFVRESPAGVDDRARSYVRAHLEGAAEAFRSLYESMRAAFRRPPANDGDTAVIFDRAADRVCRKCSLRGTCWERDYVTTFNALNDATQAMLDRGHGEAGDFPSYFSSRCVHFSAFLEAVNEELTALLYRRQYNSRIRDSREAVCRQYAQLSTLLRSAAVELGQEFTPDPVRERRVRQHLAMLGLEGEVSVYYDMHHRLRAEIHGPDCARLSRPEELKNLTDLLGLPMRREEESGGELLLVQAEPLMAVAGIAARKKDGETVSGDSGTWFKRGDGRLYVLLCDGMGSGAAAGRESGLAVRLLEQFLQAGVETENALVILNSALALRGEEEGGFTTVDLLQVDLFTGEGGIFKFGAAPTYVKKGTGVQRITGGSLPAGLAAGEHARPDFTRLHLEPGDCVVMVSDGICGTGDDGWLRERLEQFDGSSPKDLARTLITDGPAQGPTDDRTALVVRLARREERVQPPQAAARPAEESKPASGGRAARRARRG